MLFIATLFMFPMCSALIAADSLCMSAVVTCKNLTHILLQFDNRANQPEAPSEHW
jgi:hypothetical protein